MSGDTPLPGSPEYARGPTVASQWPADVDLDALYLSERSEVDELVRSAADMSVWAVEARKDNAMVYLHTKNSERLSYSVRAVTKVAGSVADVLECLRAPDNAGLKGFQKLLHPRNFLDGEVLHAHDADAASAHDGASLESMTLKWLVYSSPKTLGRSKEFCIREYCVLLPNHPVHGNVGMLKFESYDGAAARYGIRGKPDAYSLTVFEPSSYVVQQTPEDPNMATVTLTFAMRKARGGESVSAGVRLTSLRLAGDLSGMQKAVQQALFAPAALAQRQEWVNDAQRTNCSLCVPRVRRRRLLGLHRVQDGQGRPGHGGQGARVQGVLGQERQLQRQRQRQPQLWRDHDRGLLEPARSDAQQQRHRTRDERCITS